MNCHFLKYKLQFKKPAGTSRGVMQDKDTYILILQDENKTAYGECNLFKNLSYDDRDGYEEKLTEVCLRLPTEKEKILSKLEEWPSIYFGVEMVLKDWQLGSRQIIFSDKGLDEDFTIPINGLIWMSSKEEMKAQIASKLNEGYTSIKLKIGAIDFKSELELITYIREQYAADDVEIRLDANGAFQFEEAKEKIKRLSELDINYIEQPIKAGQWQEMAALAESSFIKIALDEELTCIHSLSQKLELIKTILPQVLILKPSLLGGFAACDEWKRIIENTGGDWVITSALESNIGLNAIAQFTAIDKTTTAQGLGTGQLYFNNFPSPYTVDSKGLHYHKNLKWDFSALS